MQLEVCAIPSAAWCASRLPALDSARTLVLAFGAPELSRRPEIFRELTEAYPHSHVLGCSTAGEIVDSCLDDQSLVLAVVQFEATELASVMAPVRGIEDSYRAGAALAGQLRRPDLRGVFVLSDGLQVNGSELVRGLNDGLPEEVVVTGGLAGDGDRFAQTWVLHEGKAVPGIVAAVGFYGAAIRLGHGSKGGWDIFGPERTVTRSEGSTLFELDGKPALELYKSYLGERAAELPASALLFPLALRTSALAEKTIVRTVLAVDETQQSMTFAGDIPQGHLAQLMRANFDRLVDGASDAAVSARGEDDQPVLSIAVSCVGRRLVLGERVEEELEAALEALPSGSRQIGFYSYGEISPYEAGHCDLHNQTMTLTTISER